MLRKRKTFQFMDLGRAAVPSAGLVLLIISMPPAAEAKLSLGVSSTNYLGIGGEGRQDSYSALDLQLDSKTDSDEIDSRLLVQSQIGLNDSSYRFIELPEAYVSTSKKWTGPMTFTLGRKIQSWGEIDDVWGTGIFQPQFRWDYLRPQSVGLLGLYQDIRSGPVHATLFYSPIFIPDRGAPLDFSDGRIRSISPWVVNPPYEIEVMSKNVPVHYDAEIPPIGQIVRQNTVAGRVEVGEKVGVWGAAAYAYKPMNQLLMSYEGDLSAAPGGTANVLLFPRVAYHHVATADFGYRGGKQMSGSISFMADIPNDDPQPLDRVNQQVGSFYSVSPTLELNPFGGSGAGRGNMLLSYLHVFGQDLPDTGPSVLVDGATSEFDSRYPFKNAFLFSAELPTWRRLTTDFKVVVDLQNPGTIVSWYFQYAPEKDWHLFLATDVLSSFSDDDSDGTNFIRRYRENDRVTGGVSYVF